MLRMIKRASDTLFSFDFMWEHFQASLKISFVYPSPPYLVLDDGNKMVNKTIKITAWLMVKLIF